jgi:hypothetical protein
MRPPGSLPRRLRLEARTKSGRIKCGKAVEDGWFTGPPDCSYKRGTHARTELGCGPRHWALSGLVGAGRAWEAAFGVRSTDDDDGGDDDDDDDDNNNNDNTQRHITLPSALLLRAVLADSNQPSQPNRLTRTIHAIGEWAVGGWIAVGRQTTGAVFQRVGGVAVGHY